MKKILYTFLPPISVIIAALFLGFFPIYWINYLLIAGIILGLTPLIFEIYSSLKSKRIDLGFPVVITILILVFLKQTKSAAVFVLLILFGQIFKEYILQRVKESIKSISKSLPDTAFIKNQDIIERKISDIKKGNIVVIKAGGRAPVDGHLLTQEASFDESVVTGESKPVKKKAGDIIVAGSINLSSYVEMQAADTSKNSTLAQIQKLVEEAQSKSAPLSRFTSRYAEITSLAALVLVAIVFFCGHNIFQSLALWVALVPVIFAIIVPVATTIGISILAQKGILIKNAEACENLTKISTFIFDKTGTLTKGMPEINEIVVFASANEKDLLRLVASIEKYSEHHLAEPILKKAKDLDLKLFPVTDVKILKGEGVSARHNRDVVLIGNLKLMKESGVTILDAILKRAQEKEESGNSAIFVSVNNKLIGIIFIADALREKSKPALDQLKKMGFRLVILTGDNKIVANKISRELGVTEVYSNLLPEDKIRFITKLKSSGEKIIMVGDGINDAPALAEADVGIAMGLRGVDIALESSNIVLLNDDLTLLPKMIDSTKSIFRIIKADLFIATAIHLFTAILVILNVIGIFGSVVFHQLSSALVLLNTMRLFAIRR